jgi:hypothetical protein
VRRARFLAGPLVLAIAWWSSSCAPKDFLGESTVNSVRVLASSSDQPFAQPGAVVNLAVLAFDGRPPAQRTVPMNVDWIAGCRDPANDAYFSCYPPRTPGELFGIEPGPTVSLDAGQALDAGVGDDGSTDAAGSADAGACATLDPDAGIAAPVISHASFVMPADAVTAHLLTPGLPTYGLALLFNIACAGDAGPLAISPGNINPQQIPFGCFDSSGKQLGADDYVLGFARVYAYAADAGPDGGPVVNHNPLITEVDEPAADGGAPTPHCFQGDGTAFVTSPLTAKLCTASTHSCPSVKIGPIVPESSQETDPFTHLRELIWVDFYSTLGGFSSNAHLLYDPTSGSVGPPSKTDVDFQPPVVGPDDPHAGYIFMVVHDDRGGAAWVTVPVQLEPEPDP